VQSDVPNHRICNYKTILEEKSSYAIEITSINYMNSLAFAKSLKLDENFEALLERKRSHIGLYTYFFEIKLTDPITNKIISTWTYVYYFSILYNIE